MCCTPQVLFSQCVFGWLKHYRVSHWDVDDRHIKWWPLTPVIKASCLWLGFSNKTLLLKIRRACYCCWLFLHLNQPQYFPNFNCQCCWCQNITEKKDSTAIFYITLHTYCRAKAGSVASPSQDTHYSLQIHLRISNWPQLEWFWTVGRHNPHRNRQDMNTPHS